MLKKICKLFHIKEKGFTLIELLVVIAILGVLAAVAIPNVSKFVGSGTVAAANTEVATVQTAAIAYVADASAQTGYVVANFSAGVGGSVNLGTYLNKPLVGTYIFDSLGYLADSTTTNTTDTAWVSTAGITAADTCVPKSKMGYW